MNVCFRTIVLFFTLISIPFCIDAQSEIHHFFSKEKEREREEEHENELKDAPAEHFYQQRAYPDQALDVKAFSNALAKAQLQDDARNGATAGFNTDWTLQGPTNIRGRVNTVAIHPTNPDIAIIGFATGGAWKTIDGGKKWTAIFEKFPTLSIGAIAFSPSNPNLVFIGTGDPNITGYPFIGNGVYKSIDGGNTWQFSGLAETKVISKIIVHPTNPDIVYLGAMGLPFERTIDRGLYKSVNGGATWSKIYHFSNQAGVIDMVMNPQNPNQLFVAGWDRIRNNKETVLTGPNCRIIKTNDAGINWTTQFIGFPTTDIGRIGLAFSTASVSTLYAVAADENQNLKGVYKSTTAGSVWQNIGSNGNLMQNAYNGMGWYFGQIRVTANEIFILGVDLWKTNNDGALWDNVTEGTDAHVDMHDLISRGGKYYLASDGGAYVSSDSGNTWTDFEQIPSTAYYRVSTSPWKKEFYYGGAQDNGTLVGNKANINNWTRMYGGDGFKTCFSEVYSNIVFAETQNGGIWVSKDSAKVFQLATFGVNISDRRSWDTPYFVSKLQKNNMYLGTEKVYKNVNIESPSWLPLSNDLTKGNIYGPQFHVITTLDESKVDSNKIYAGTSDGKVWTNSPQSPFNWVDISTGLPDRYVTSIHTSPFDQNTVYVTHSGYKDNVNTPHVHKSINGGTTWSPINGNLPLFAVNDLFILPNHADSILFVATDGGIYATVDRGVFWQRLGKNMPYTIVYDIEWDQSKNLLIAATHGRAMMTYPIDSITYKAPPLLSVSGKIQTYSNQNPVKNVIVTAVAGGKTFTTKTDSLGIYNFDAKFTKGTKIVITALKKEKGSNGLSTIDLLEIQKHILDTKKISSSTALIAADANKSGTITTGDIVATRKIILSILDSFPHGMAWRFIPESYKFPVWNDPFNPAFPENIMINSLDSSKVNLNFTAVKIGDVNESAKTNLRVVKNNGSSKAIKRKED